MTILTLPFERSQRSLRVHRRLRIGDDEWVEVAGEDQRGQVAIREANDAQLEAIEVLKTIDGFHSGGSYPWPGR